MIGLLRAEWLRLRRRKDIWFVCLAVLAAAWLAGRRPGPRGA